MPISFSLQKSKNSFRPKAFSLHVVVKNVVTLKNNATKVLAAVAAVAVAHVKCLTLFAPLVVAKPKCPLSQMAASLCTAEAAWHKLC